MKSIYFFTKRVLLIAFLLSLYTTGKSQYVTIPDANFVSYLQANFPTAMVGNQLDTTDVNVVTAWSINVEGLGIYNLSGVQYFDSIHVLVASDNPLNAFPPLRDGIWTIYVNGCGLNSIPALPSGLYSLHCDTNAITSLPPLPANLDWLTCNQCNLTSLPALPATLTQLACKSNSLQCLPVLPNALTTLYASGNPGLSCIPNLPANLMTTDIGTDPCAKPTAIITTPVTCNGANDGEITLTMAGCNAPYSFYWSNSSVTQNQSALAAGTYTCTVTDNNSTTYTFSAVVTEPSSLLLLPLPDVALCAGDSIYVCPVVSGGVSPYLYQINGTAITGCYYASSPGSYTVLVTDANGCTATDYFTIINFPAISFNLPATLPYCDNLNATCVSVTGGASPYTFQWNDQSTDSCHYFLNSGVYALTVTDAAGCSATQSTIVGNGIPVSASLSSTVAATCGNCDGSVTLSYSGGLPPYTLNFTPFPPPNLNALCANDFFEVAVTDQNACATSYSYLMPSSCDEVWPGDANHDGTANNMDLLAIGIGYGTAGIPRPGATINWQPETCPDWADSLVNGTNFKHVDCNGDGIIATDDTIAILQNYGLSHPLRLAATQNTITDPPLYFNIALDTTGTSQQLSLPLMLGSAALPMNNVYGIAFTVNYDTSLVKADSISLSFPFCWLGYYGTDAIGISKNDPVNGRLFAAITRIAHTDTSGFGEVARLTVVTTDNVSGRLTQAVYDTLLFTLSDVRAINFAENILPVAIMNDSLIIEDLTSVNEIQWQDKTLFYPNPVTDYLKIRITGSTRILNLEVMDMLGQPARFYHTESGTDITVGLTGNSNGMYSIRITTDRGVLTKKINLQRH